jgi:hypothetical protein
MVGNRVKTIEMGTIQLSIIQNGELFTGLLHESLQANAYIEKKVKEANQILRKYIKNNRINIRSQYIHDIEFRNEMRSILSQDNEESFKISEKEIKIIKYLKNKLKLDEIEGILLFSNNGKLIFSTVGDKELKHFFKEIDFRVKICNNSILKLFYTSHKNIIFSDYIEDSFFLILIYNLNINFGLADHYLNKIVEGITFLLKLDS